MTVTSTILWLNIISMSEQTDFNSIVLFGGRENHWMKISYIFLWHSIAFKILREYYCSCKHLTATHTIVLPLELLQEQCPNEKRSFTYFTNSLVHAAKRAFCRHLKIRGDRHWIHQDEKSKNSGRSTGCQLSMWL